MSPIAVGSIGIGVLILLVFSGMPVGFSMALVGFLGFASLVSLEGALGVLRTLPFAQVASYTMCVIPLFVLMGEFASHSGIIRDFYRSVYTWLGSLPGGLAITSIAGCAGFASICGSSLATAVAMGSIALPEMREYKYDDSLATGSVAAGGTLGILIPPSMGFILYAILTQESIGKLFLSGFLPGLLLASLFALLIYVRCRVNESLGPPGPSTSLKAKLVAVKGVWAILILFVLVIGGIYAGIFTPTEAAGVGAFGSLVIGLGKRKLTWGNFVASLNATVRIAVMAFIIVIGAFIFGRFLTVSKIPSELVALVSGLQLPRTIIMLGIMLVYLALGCIMDMFAIIVITVPIFFPLVVALGFDPIWFGVIIVIMGEMGLITPPVGLNVYVIAGVARDVPMFTIFRGVSWFLVPMWILIFLLLAFPQIALFLPGLMK